MKKFKTREEILQNAIDYYWGKPERKCLSKIGSTCIYSPSDTSMGCAIGRLVSKKVAVKLDELGSSVGNLEIFELLPEWLKAMGQDFLHSLQSLHDMSTFVIKDESCVRRKMFDFVDMDKIVFPEDEK